MHGSLPVGEDEIGDDGADVLVETLASPLCGSGVDLGVFEAAADNVDGERQQVHGGEHHSEVLLAVAGAVLDVGSRWT